EGGALRDPASRLRRGDPGHRQARRLIAGSRTAPGPRSPAAPASGPAADRISAWPGRAGPHAPGLTLDGCPFQRGGISRRGDGKPTTLRTLQRVAFGYDDEPGPVRPDGDGDDHAHDFRRD